MKGSRASVKKALSAVSTLADGLLSLLFPSRCAACQKLVPLGTLFCGACMLEPLPQKLVELSSSTPVQAAAVFAYDDTSSQAILAMKEYQDRRMLDFYSIKMVELAELLWDSGRWNAVVCVPMSKKVRRQRGFNHAQLLAKAVACRLGLPLLSHALIRHNFSLPQRNLARTQRFSNATASFAAGREAVSGMRILLVDDVCTTGATALACADCLRNMGALSVDVLTVCASKQESELHNLYRQTTQRA